MIEQEDDRLTAWVQSILGEVTILLGPPGREETGQGVSLYLFELVEAPPLRERKLAPLQFSLRYLVTTWAESPAEGHRLLGKIAFAALENPDLEVAFEPLPGPVWQAFGLAPRPSFILRVPVRQERPEPPPHYVLKPLELQGVPMTQLYGVVLGPFGVPLAGARVEMPSLHVATTTDAKGLFRFANVPAEPRAMKLRIQAKGETLDVTVEQPADGPEPVTIRFNLFNLEQER